MTLYPDGYSTELITLEEMVDRHGPGMHPEYSARFFAYITYKAGLLGVGGGWRGQSDVSDASAAGKSFHQDQTFASGFCGYCAVDLVCPVPGGVHRAPTWDECADASLFGLHTFIDGEPWHIQCIEMRGFDSWVNAGRPDPPLFPLPGQPPNKTGVVDMYVIAVSRNGWPGPVDLVVDSRNVMWNRDGNTSSLDKVAGVPRLEVDKNQTLGILRDRPGYGECPFETQPDYFDAELAAAW